MIKPDARRRAALAHYGEVARLGKALASPVRLQLLDLLRQGSRNVEDLAQAAGVTVANSSRHLQQMRAARLVSAAREGRHVRYRLAGDGVSDAFGVLRGLAEALLPEMDRLRGELRALRADEREALLDRLGRGGVTLLDVRPAEEYRHGHLPGARSIPLPELPSRLGEVPRDREVVAYCRGPYCSLATEAVSVLVAAGFRARHLDLGPPDLTSRGVALATAEAGDGIPVPPARTRARRVRATHRRTPRRPR
jgi:rhodanese-related sulfurtransferase/DNA-binding transcriptional ArsR family regulator